MGVVEQPDESHVVVERQPRDADVVGSEAGRGDDAVEVGGDAAVRQHHALRIGCRAARVLEDRERIGIVGGAHVRRRARRDRARVRARRGRRRAGRRARRR